MDADAPDAAGSSVRCGRRNGWGWPGSRPKPTAECRHPDPGIVSVRANSFRSPSRVGRRQQASSEELRTADPAPSTGQGRGPDTFCVGASAASIDLWGSGRPVMAGTIEISSVSRWSAASWLFDWVLRSIAATTNDPKLAAELLEIVEEI